MPSVEAVAVQATAGSHAMCKFSSSSIGGYLFSSIRFLFLSAKVKRISEVYKFLLEFL
jgi:hypothetical protein